ncbi:endonuclease/exonuclease/phosphatase family protein [Exilibacterium tricleocarpae]|uniref:Endonuclease/exonuclease/phosphatase family protein n=2 Tax=Exilibacterium tricleocarpae TaxID=2591008 RepID=A0A545TAN3_9GAMM|nr:endonuclease/exonuclease/phosphatase family protein [Exilibacterium tricleocarpae]
MSADLSRAAERGDHGLVRFATFNAFLNRNTEGQLIADLRDPDDQMEAGNDADVQIKAVAEIIQRVRPDVLLLNEFDYDGNGEALALFQENYLGVSQNGQPAIHFDYTFNAPSNTGVPSGKDFDNDGSTTGPGDAYGFGFFPGQFGMALLSKYPIEDYRARTFRHFLWRDMPDALLPDDDTTPAPGDYYSADEQAVFRLSSKSHWDVPVSIRGRTVHVLAAHPTPPVFDGPEDRNGRRNHDEIRFWADYVGPYRGARYIRDDAGRRGGLGSYRPFVIMGDYNADPFDGDSFDGAINQLLQHPAVDAQITPASLGGFADAAAEGLANELHAGNPAFDTADFNPNNPGNLRVDYVLPSRRGLQPVCGGVFRPTENDESFYLVGAGFPVISSDHHLVWMDIRVRGGYFPFFR